MPPNIHTIGSPLTRRALGTQNLHDHQILVKLCTWFHSTFVVPVRLQTRKAQRKELLDGVEQLDAAVATQDAAALASLFATDAILHEGAYAAT